MTTANGGEYYVGLGAGTGTGSFGTVNGVYVGLNLAATAGNVLPVTTVNGVNIDFQSQAPDARITNVYGIKMNDVTRGGTTNYGIYTGLGKISFGDFMEIRRNTVASTPAAALLGTWYTGGTTTTTKPQLLIEPTATTSTGWNTNGTGLGVNAAAGFTGNLIDVQINGVSKAMVSATGGITSSGTGGIGYSTGAGGTVAQATNKATAVTLNKLCGTITMMNTNLAAAGIVSFIVNNNTVAATDVVHVQHDAVGTLGAYTVSANTMAAGTFNITIRNNTAGILGEAIVIRFVVVKAVIN